MLIYINNSKKKKGKRNKLFGVTSVFFLLFIVDVKLITSESRSQNIFVQLHALLCIVLQLRVVVTMATITMCWSFGHVHAPPPCSRLLSCLSGSNSLVSFSVFSCVILFSSSPWSYTFIYPDPSRSRLTLITTPVPRLQKKKLWFTSDSLSHVTKIRSCVLKILTHWAFIVRIQLSDSILTASTHSGKYHTHYTNVFKKK